MNALELVEYLESGYDTHMHEAATMLCKQDTAIKQLREALEAIVNSAAANAAAILTPLVDDAQQALAATEEFAK